MPSLVGNEIHGPAVGRPERHVGPQGEVPRQVVAFFFLEVDKPQAYPLGPLRRADVELFRNDESTVRRDDRARELTVDGYCPLSGGVDEFERVVPETMGRHLFPGGHDLGAIRGNRLVAFDEPAPGVRR